MNNNLTLFLSMLETNLSQKQDEAKTLYESTTKSALESISAGALSWLQENVNPLIQKIELSYDRLEIMKYGDSSRWGGCFVNLLSRYQGSTVNKYAEMGWYSSRATTKDGFVLTDVQIFGSVAKCLNEIENEMIYNWNPQIEETKSQEYKLDKEIHVIEMEISKVKNAIRTEKIEEYKTLGRLRACSIPVIFNISDGVATLEAKIESTSNKNPIQLVYGRSRYDYVYIKAFKILEKKKGGKFSVEVTMHGYDNRSKTSVFEITAKNLDNLVEQYYVWENETVNRLSKKETEKYNKWMENQKEQVTA